MCQHPSHGDSVVGFHAYCLDPMKYTLPTLATGLLAFVLISFYVCCILFLKCEFAQFSRLKNTHTNKPIHYANKQKKQKKKT